MGAVARLGSTGTDLPCFSGRTPLSSAAGDRRQVLRSAPVAALRTSSAPLTAGPPPTAQSNANKPAAKPTRAVSVTWGEWVTLADSESYEESVEDSWFNDSEAQKQRQMTPAAAVAANTPLKINLDLLLYRARVDRLNSMKTSDPTRRAELLASALAKLQRCIDMDPLDGRAYVGMGKIYMWQRRWDEARKLYDEGTTATGGMNAHLWQAWGTLERKRGNPDKARKLFDAATVADWQHAAAWHGWGLLEKEEGNYTRARDLWRKGIDATRDNPNPHLYSSIAVLAQELGYVAEARRWFREGTQLMPRGKRSHALWQSWALLEAEDGGEARLVRSLFRSGLEANPRSRYTYLAWALWEKERGQLENACLLLAKGHELNPWDPAILQAWACLHEERGNVCQARALFEKGSRVDPSHVPLWQAWGVMEFREGNLAEARRLFQQGVWAEPDSRDIALVFQAWGVLEERAGNPDLARELYRCAVKANPRSEVAWLTWAQLEANEGNTARANELRSIMMQERVEVVPPSRFTTLPRDGPLRSVLSSLQSWFSSTQQRSVEVAASDRAGATRSGGDTYGGGGGSGGGASARAAGSSRVSRASRSIRSSTAVEELARPERASVGRVLPELVEH